MRELTPFFGTTASRFRAVDGGRRPHAAGGHVGADIRDPEHAPIPDPDRGDRHTAAVEPVTDRDGRQVEESGRARNVGDERLDLMVDRVGHGSSSIFPAPAPPGARAQNWTTRRRPGPDLGIGNVLDDAGYTTYLLRPEGRASITAAVATHARP